MDSYDHFRFPLEAALERRVGFTAHYRRHARSEIEQGLAVDDVLCADRAQVSGDLRRIDELSRRAFAEALGRHAVGPGGQLTPEHYSAFQSIFTRLMGAGEGDVLAGAGMSQDQLSDMLLGPMYVRTRFYDVGDTSLDYELREHDGALVEMAIISNPSGKAVFPLLPRTDPDVLSDEVLAHLP